MTNRIAAIGLFVLIAGCGKKVTDEGAKAPEPAARPTAPAAPFSNERRLTPL